jgi:hypothetical protein
MEKVRATDWVRLSKGQQILQSNKEKQAFNAPQTSTNGQHKRAKVVLSHTTMPRRRNIAYVKRF